ncbi:MAG TPA: acyl-CoA dehydrogenase family protein [Oligoflexus sp.]|uniref:acyl-CoA dehydrogenase family protein n=1 Tax=Oligoflexus sp. TaxID=1971216 RepID=UPI002D3FDDE3|nr:acyl-CoA dehydrogenase family protein [Oligoflexus sp.]HYX37197.1 acyl-CoA dehydrogenase family protein [Oligoflexus sp.]
MLQDFRVEVRQWLDANCPVSMRTPIVEEEEVWGGSQEKFKNPDSKIWLERMSAKGWTAPEWPKAYGGGGLKPQEVLILKEEMAKLGCRPPLLSFGIWMLGPVLLQYGTEEQKKAYLPKITRGEVRWCQGYSEPAAGSDLASLQTRAELVGDQFVINGSKVWTSYADSSDWIFCLVRTDPSAGKQQGISFMLIDMHQPGVKAEPIRLISGASPFCEVFFSDAKTSQDNLIGPLNGGWQIAKALLTHERQAISEINKKASELPLEIVAKQKMPSLNGRLADEHFRQRLAAWHMDNTAFEWTLERELSLQKAGHSPGAASSMFKLYGTELNKRKYELMMEAAGFQSLVWEGTGDEKDRQATRDWLRSKGNSIEGGTSEIQLNVIAKRVLGLP